MTVWIKHEGYKMEEMSLTDMHTIIDALEYHREACEGVANEYAGEHAKEEIVDINNVLTAIFSSGISELAGRVPVDIIEPEDPAQAGKEAS